MVENELQATSNSLRVRAREALPQADGGGVFAGAEHGAAVSVVLVDAVPGNEQAPHVHPVPGETDGRRNAARCAQPQEEKGT